MEDEAEDAGIPMPIISAVHEYFNTGEQTTRDNVGRPGPWLWHELTGQKRKER